MKIRVTRRPGNLENLEFSRNFLTLEKRGGNDRELHECGKKSEKIPRALEIQNQYRESLY